MAAITITTTARTAHDPLTVDQAAASGDYLQNTGFELLFIYNGGMSSINLTIDFPDTALIDGVAPTPPVVAVGAGIYKILGPFPTDIYNDSNGRVQFSYSATTSVTVAAFLPTTE